MRSHPATSDGTPRREPPRSHKWRGGALTNLAVLLAALILSIGAVDSIVTAGGSTTEVSYEPAGHTWTDRVGAILAQRFPKRVRPGCDVLAPNVH